jgi:hypothetical protein
LARITDVLGLTLLGLLTAATGGWGVLALAISGPSNGALRLALAAGFGLFALAAIVALGLPAWRWRAFAAYLVLFAAAVAWFRSLPPSNDRDWQPDVAVLPHATIEGDLVTVHNIRNFTYRSEFDYTPDWYTKRFDLRDLESVDLVAVYWMGPAIAHTFLSFGFRDGEHLAISIETRKEKGEAYSTVKGFFRQYELYYVVGDERDVIGLRTNHRRDPPEDVYVYRIEGTAEEGRRFFMEYVQKMNQLARQAQWYNSMTTNCTTNIWTNAGVNPGRVPFSWKILASGYVPQYLYEQGRLVTGGLPFEELRRRAYVNTLAQAAEGAADFSRRIRAMEAQVTR